MFRRWIEVERENEDEGVGGLKRSAVSCNLVLPYEIGAIVRPRWLGQGRLVVVAKRIHHAANARSPCHAG